jgi:hypothetical protein
MLIAIRDMDAAKKANFGGKRMKFFQLIKFVYIFGIIIRANNACQVIT